MPHVDDRASTRGPDTAHAIALGWEILRKCRHDSGATPRLTFGPNVDQAFIEMVSTGGHSYDIDLALLYSAADQLDPEGEWDRAAAEHVRRAAEHLPRIVGRRLGLFVGLAGFAFCLRALSRGGERYQRAIAGVESDLATGITAALNTVGTDGVSTDFYDVIAGLAGAVTYTMTTSARDGELGEISVTAITKLAELALLPGPGGLWTPADKARGSEKSKTPALSSGYLNYGFAHGIAGVLNVLSQACDRGLGGPVVGAAAAHLAQLLTAGITQTDMADIPCYLPYSPQPGNDHPFTTRSRYAWCYGNLGTALPFFNSRLLRNMYPGLVERLLRVSDRTDAELGLGNASLCHGHSGRLVLERIMVGEHTVPANVTALLGLRNPTRNFEFDNHQTGVDIDSPSFLEGSGGAAIALMSLQAAPEQLDCLRMLTGKWPDQPV